MSPELTRPSASKASFLRLLALIALLSPLFTSCSYNSLVDKRTAVDTQWANVEAVYQRRSDLIPNLVATVKGAAASEERILTGVIEARSQATRINLKAEDLTEENLAKFQQAQDKLGSSLNSALSRLMVVQEQYPQLQSQGGFMALQSQLEGTESRITTERRRYNELVGDYNASIQRFPANLTSGMFGFKPKPLFKATAGAENAPKVEF
jgi:LemA protein